MAAAYSSYWSELHPDLLVLIFSRLEVVEFIRAAATCRSWRQLKSRLKDLHVRPKNQIPWLMLSSPAPFQTQFRCFHSLLPGSYPRGIRFPEITGQFCMGSSQGFLVSLDETTANLRAINPVTGAHIPLPPTSTIACAGAFFIQNFSFAFGKAILSPNPGFDGLPQTAAFFYFGNLAFAKPGDCKWTLLANSPVLCLGDILFHKNRLHAVNWTGALTAFDLRDPSVPHSLLCVGLPSEEIRHTKCYLVESPDGHDLYYVTRSIDLFCPDIFCDRDDDHIHKTTGFWVYKLDELEGQWIEVNTLEDLALFLGCNHSLAVSTTEHPNVKRNSIYFTDDYRECSFNRQEYIGVFDLVDGSVQLSSLSDHLRCLNWPPPIWFTPVLF